MVQLGSIHIGRTTDATPPQLDIGEAFILADFLYFRYDCIEQTQLYYKAAHDPEFKKIIQAGLVATLNKQVDIIEKQLTKYKVPQPSREPKSLNTVTDSVIDSSIISDQFIFLRIFSGCKSYLAKHAQIIGSIINNESIRTIFIDMLKDEADIFHNLCKYGKLKGWLPVYPTYKP